MNIRNSCCAKKVLDLAFNIFFLFFFRCEEENETKIETSLNKEEEKKIFDKENQLKSNEQDECSGNDKIENGNKKLIEMKSDNATADISVETKKHLCDDDKENGVLLCYLCIKVNTHKGKSGLLL